ncbi:MAG: hypothetical protein QOF18_1690 [Frankiaceae bacterium]|jgi:hypothetical protein|nr:hypothetical protein [Frankiaceae bacterium]
MRTRPSLTVAAAAASMVLIGGIAYAAVQSVDTTPKSQILVPRTSATQPSHSRGSDDPASHDINDDHGGRISSTNGSTGGTGTGGTDDPVGHDANDDHGGSGHDSSSHHGGSGRSGSGHGSDG